jgi:hypothetical protein
MPLIAVRNGHGNFDIGGKFTKSRLCSFVQSMEKKFCKCMGIFIIDAMVILPFVKIFQEKIKCLCHRLGNLFTFGPGPQINLIPGAGLNFLIDMPTPDFGYMRPAYLRLQSD